MGSTVDVSQRGAQHCRRAQHGQRGYPFARSITAQAGKTGEAQTSTNASPVALRRVATTTKAMNGATWAPLMRPSRQEGAAPGDRK